MNFSPIEAYWAIREACIKRPELRFSNWETLRPTTLEYMKDDPFTGFCYVATEVFCYLVPESRRRKCYTVNHHFATVDGQVWDLTAEQFKRVLDYDDSYQINRKPLTERATLLLEAIE